MFVDVELDGGDEAAVLQIPVSAVQRHQGAVFSFVACGPGQFARRDVQLGPSTSERVEVKAGLDEGDRVVVQGGFALKSELFNDSVVE
jgi:cobalt-zinc-cadmium efflux system membrane fusion protein